MRGRVAVIVLVSLASVAIVGCGQSDSRVFDLHAVDWQTVVLLGSICGGSQPIHLRGGQAVVRSTPWRPYRRMAVDTRFDRVAYGDLDGDSHDEAALGVDCNNGGGTADGILAFARVIFTGGRHAPQVIGVVTPQQQVSPHASPTLVQVRIKPAAVFGTPKPPWTITGPDEGLWTVYGSLLREERGEHDDTEYDAHLRAIRRLRQADPALLQRLNFDPESTGTAINAPTRDDLETALRILGLKP
jgi:hypothetical protein